MEGVALSTPLWETAATACRPPLVKIGLFIKILEGRAPAPLSEVEESRPSGFNYL